MDIFSKLPKLGIALIVFFAFIPLFVFSQASSGKNTIKVMDFEKLKPKLHQQNDTVYVINFWATWCAPCIKEIPYFEQIGQKYKNEKVKVLMVSTDFANQLQTRVIPFVEKHQMKNEVILLDDPRANRWIPQVDENWTGTIPATLVYRNTDRSFYQKELTFEELDEVIQSKLNK